MNKNNTTYIEELKKDIISECKENQIAINYGNRNRIFEMCFLNDCVTGMTNNLYLSNEEAKERLKKANPTEIIKGLNECYINMKKLIELMEKKDFDRIDTFVRTGLLSEALDQVIKEHYKEEA